MQIIRWIGKQSNLAEMLEFSPLFTLLGDESMNYQMIIGLQLLYIAPSILLYIAEFFYILVCKDPEFSSAFYYIFLIRAPADLIQVTVSLVAFRLPLADWRFVVDKPYIAKLGFVVSNFACNIELFAQLILSVNRLTAIWFPLRHNSWWTLRRTVISFLVCALAASIPAVVKFCQEAGYVAVEGKVVPYLIHEEDQKWVDQQLVMARRLQLNLLVYSSAFTVAIMSMTVCQCLLALDVFPLKTDGHSVVILVLVMSADCFALSNPWLLFALSSTFRSKFSRVGSGLPTVGSSYTV
ncbi:unnamed protein product [Nippostrongylus brasiliensis]|uniref:Serpentine receptor class gamma (inferred by orthology to a C. elegans protein) n=1 Tax=Nippostrongylus brasiliensis TaxID=27835 RepID=A0A0N4YNA1_NIPBR|nr:unnamed protein product [Nippostrongylus brasiliensis]